ncbi:hypothetical protein PAXRUDRAFT_821727 [Paxillus rubicundulus Ve08.2h10]|uniref:Uncharacterized protein n=1 Tax=Paxillus rubicundulus Ve08.2h10 TaxID=930991 RepID=A0A0D0DXP2_9AGAM|nr:hypothetical protein PAXRUDRAFT_821727 [Paxillus rubicundulus Ve08.2h10]
MPNFRPNIRVLRDMKARQGVKENEVIRRAYLYVARNESLPPHVRHQAQLQLNSFGRYTRPTAVVNRCTESGRGQGVLSEFGLCRVISIPTESIEQRDSGGQEGILVIACLSSTRSREEPCISRMA